jgi:dihydropteroate synthase
MDQSRAVEHGLRLVDEGAAILDIGGESTRPNSTPVAEQEELRRVIGVVRELAERTSIPISIDTSKAKVAQEALAAGAEILNDVTGLESDPKMIEVAISSQAGVCVMHMQGTPQTMQDDPRYENVVEEIHGYLTARYNALVTAGVDARRICVDPGIGFGKTHQHNLTLLAAMGRYHDLGAPLLVGPSRKSYLAKILGDAETDRTAAIVGVSLRLARAGVQIIRLHDVLPVRHALLSFAATGGIDGRELVLE